MLLTLIKVAGCMPLAVRQRCADIGGRIFSVLPLRERTIAQLQLRRALPKVRVPIHRVYQNAARVLMESLNLAPLLKQVDTTPLVERWARHPDSPRALIALSGHVGNWELIAAATAHEKIPILAIAREARHPSWQKVLEKIRGGNGLEILWRADKLALRRLAAAVRSRTVIAALLDQDTVVKSEFAPFFGKPAAVPSTVIDLGLRAGCTFIAAFSIRSADGTYRFELTDLPGRTIDEILSYYHTALERILQRNPEQWVWFHKRWRSLPTGKRLSSREYIEALERECHSLAETSHE